MKNTSPLNLRNWQKKGILTFADKYNQCDVFRTIAYQGSGKTLFTAMCYIVDAMSPMFNVKKSIRPLKEFLEGNTDHIKSSFVTLQKHNQFSPVLAIIFVPTLSILSSTKRDWARVGIRVEELNNDKMRHTSPKELIDKGIRAIVLTYQQSVNNHLELADVWENNHLVKFIRRSPEVAIHAVLDECHNLAIHREYSRRGDIKETYTKNARFFICNRALFRKIHLLTGTPRKKRGYYEDYEKKDSTIPLIDDQIGQPGKRLRYVDKIPFWSYDKEGKLIPDVLFGRKESEESGTIVTTQIKIHPIEKVVVNMDGQDICLSDEDLFFYSDNAYLIIQNKYWHENFKRTLQIHKAFRQAYESIKLWEQMLIYAKDWLQQIREKYPKALGIIFAPTADVAIRIHRELLLHNSILCLGSQSKVQRQSTYVSSRKIHDYLDEKRPAWLDFIVTCEALKEGFDYPDCKLSVLLPRIDFLSPTKVDQMLGRTNRAIPGYEGLHAVCLTLNYKPVRTLIEENQQQGLYISCNPEDKYSDIVKIWTEETVANANERITRAIADEPPQDDKSSEVKLVELSSFYFDYDQCEDFDYDEETLKKVRESRIRSEWTLWADIVRTPNGFLVSKLPPDQPGVYIMRNAVTGECLYVGQSHNLRSRIGSKSRFANCEWLYDEGHSDVYVKWELCENNLEYHEQRLKSEYNPKYDKEPPHQLRVAS